MVTSGRGAGDARGGRAEHEVGVVEHLLEQDAEAEGGQGQEDPREADGGDGDDGARPGGRPARPGAGRPATGRCVAGGEVPERRRPTAAKARWHSEICPEVLTSRPERQEEDDVDQRARPGGQVARRRRSGTKAKKHEGHGARTSRTLAGAYHDCGAAARAVTTRRSASRGPGRHDQHDEEDDEGQARPRARSAS